ARRPGADAPRAGPGGPPAREARAGGRGDGPAVPRRHRGAGAGDRRAGPRDGAGAGPRSPTGGGGTHHPTMSLLTRFSLRLGTVVLLAVVLLFGAGVFAATRVPQDLLPDITLPAFILVTPDPGASPDAVDRDVAVPVTNAVQSLNGVDTITSISS